MTKHRWASITKGYKQDVRHTAYTQAQFKIAQFEVQVVNFLEVSYHLIKDVR